jgi:hypothetical protein
METAFLAGTSPAMMAGSTAAGGATGTRRNEGNVALGLFSKIAAARKENLSTFVRCDNLRACFDHASLPLNRHALCRRKQPLVSWERQAAALTRGQWQQGQVTFRNSAIPAVRLVCSSEALLVGCSKQCSLSSVLVHLARNPALRTPAISERKVHARAYPQNLRWSKKSVPEEPLGAVGSPTTVSSAVFNAPGVNRAVSATTQRSVPVSSATAGSRRRHLLPPHEQLYQQRRPTTESVGERLLG